MNNLTDVVRSFKRYSKELQNLGVLDFLKSNLTERLYFDSNDIRNTIMINGVGRSGTTWLGTLISN